MRSKWLFRASACGCLLGGVPAGTQELTGKFPATALLVQVPVTVTDDRGNAIDDLAMGDFLVVDQGDVQDLALFQACGRESGNPTTSPVAAIRPNHYLVVLFEPMRLEPRARAIKATRAYLSGSQTRGLSVAIVDGPRLVQDFSTDLGLALQHLSGVGPRNPGVIDRFGFWQGPAIALLDRLASVAGRKSMVQFVDLAIGARQGFLVPSALRANVAMYPVDARGLEVLVPFGEAATEYSFGPAGGSPGGFAMVDGMTSQMAAWSEQASVLAEVAAATGGESVANDNDLEGIFRRVEENGRGLYLLGYYLSGPMLDGRFHRVEVKVSRDHVRVRAKAGYLAPRP